MARLTSSACRTTSPPSARPRRAAPPANTSTLARPRSTAAPTRSSATSSPRWCWVSESGSSQEYPMNFSFTEEQTLLRDSLAAYLADHYAFDDRRAAIRAAPGWRPEVWRAFAEDLGILGAAFPEELGGLGGGPTETLVIMEELGKALVV